MLGDGVNDARALKAAQVGVAMRSGSAVTRDVADIVLTEDSLAALVPARHEGRRIIGGIATSMQVFLSRVATQGLVIVTVTMLGLGFPYSPAQVGLTLLTVGVPSLLLTMWARSEPPDPHLLANLGRFVIPAALVTAGFAVGIYALHYTDMLQGFSVTDAPASFVQAFEEWTGVSADDAGFEEAVATVAAQTALSTFVSYAAFLLILFLKPPSRLFAAWTQPDGDKRPAILAAVLVVAFSGLLFVPWFTDYFGLTEAAEPVFETVLPALVLWFFVLTAVFRLRLLDRLLGLDLLTEPGRSGR
jgi:cation-transporting ATPase E